MTQARVHALVYGLVQGVGYRDFVARRARLLGLTGYVRNLPDGETVEVIAEGDRPLVEELLQHLHAGPPGAAVRRVETAWLEPPPQHQSFEILF